MRTIGAVALVLFLSVAARAQSATVDYDQSVTVVDSSGNLLVIDSGLAVTTGTTSGGTVSLLSSAFFPIHVKSPSTRLTVVPHGATAASTPVIYSGASFQVIGVGKEAIYALVTVQSGSGSSRISSQEIVAINANLSLPAAVSGFPSESVGSGDSVELGPAGGSVDYISVIAPSMRATATVAAVGRTATVYGFDTSFHLVSQGMLP